MKNNKISSYVSISISILIIQSFLIIGYAEINRESSFEPYNEAGDSPNDFTSLKSELPIYEDPVNEFRIGYPHDWQSQNDEDAKEDDGDEVDEDEEEVDVIEESNVITVGSSGYDYTSIQEAINASWPGDTIEVYSGTYRENINVTKTLTLLGIDDDNGKPVIDADSGIYAIKLSSDGICLEGFEVINSQEDGAGIYVHSDDTFIWGNEIRNNGYGILTTLFHGWRSTFENNTIENNIVGMSIGSGSNIVKGNLIIENEDSGIIIDELSSNNTIENNDIASNEGVGIALYSSFRNCIKENTVRDNGKGGIITYDSGKNTINNNTVQDNEIYGIVLTESFRNNVTYNRISGSQGAIFIGNSSENNTIAGNSVNENRNGIYILNSSGNVLYQNRLKDNYRFNAYDNGENKWDEGSIGNYYSDVECIDGDGNEICDSEYTIPGGSSIDRYPEENVVSSIVQPRIIASPETPGEVEIHINDLTNEDASVRIKAARTLGKINDSRAIDPLIDALQDDNFSVSFSAASALGDMGVAAVGPLIQTLQDKKYQVRSNAAYALGEIKDRNAVVPLIQALLDKEWLVRENAAEALGKIKDERSVEPLIYALEDEEWNVRFESVIALGKIKDERAVEPLIQALWDDEPIIRKFAARSLGDIGDAKAADALKEALKDDDLDVRLYAKEALEKIEDRDGI